MCAHINIKRVWEDITKGKKKKTESAGDGNMVFSYF